MNRVVAIVVMWGVFLGAAQLQAEEVSLTVLNNSFETFYWDGSYDRPTSWTLEDPVNSRIKIDPAAGANDGGYRLWTHPSGPEVDRLYQSIDISAYADVVDDGGSTLDAQSYGRNTGPPDVAEMWIVCADAGASGLSTSLTAVTSGSTWHALTVTNFPVTVGTRAVQIWLSLDRSAAGGSWTDAYLDGPVAATLDLVPSGGTVVVVR